MQMLRFLYYLNDLNTCLTILKHLWHYKCAKKAFKLKSFVSYIVGKENPEIKIDPFISGKLPSGD